MNARSATAVALAAAALPAAAPVALAAPVLETPLKGCYVSVDTKQRELVTLRAAGFSGGAIVDAFVDGVRRTPRGVLADASGRVVGEVTAPFQAAGQRPFEIELVERGNDANRLAASAYVTALAVRLRPRRAQPSDVVRFRGRGFIDPGPVFAHYLYAGRLRRTVRLATPSRACGTFSVRARQIPVRHARTGTWTVQIDQLRRYSPVADPVFVRLTIEVARKP